MDTTYGDFPIEEIEGYHFEENTDGKIKNAATRVLRDCRIFGNCGKNLINLDAGIDAKGVLIKNNDGTYKLTKVGNDGLRFSESIPVYIPQNTGFIISYELIEYTGAESFSPLICLFKYSDGTTVECVPKNTLSTNKRIYSTYYIKQKADIIRLQLVCMSSSNQPIGSYTVFKNFQIELGDESYSEGIDYESYAEVGDSDTESGKYILPVTVSGKNLLPYPYYETTKTVNGITFTDNGDGSITVNGTATDYATFNAVYDAAGLVHNGIYFLSGCPNKNIKGISLQPKVDGVWNPEHYDLCNGKTVTVQSFITTISIQINPNTVCDNLVFKPQLELGETATDFEPYTAPKTTNLLLDAPLGPGESISCREKGLLVPELATTDPQITNYISFGSKIKPSSAKFEYYKY